MDFNLNKLNKKLEPPLIERMQGKNEILELTGFPGLDLDVVRPRFDEYLARVSNFEFEAVALEVKDDESRERAANLAGGSKKLIKAIEAKTKEVIGPADAFIKSVRGFAGKFTDRLKSAADLAGKKEIAYIERQEMARREAEKKAQEAMAKAQAEIDQEAKEKGIEPIQLAAPIVPETKTTAKTELGYTSYTQRRWVGEIYNPDAVERIYCSPDQRKIDDAIKNGVRAMAGVNIYEKTEIRHRS